MKDAVRRAAAALRKNRGSGMVVVLVSMLFVMLLGAALLYTSYTSYLVKMTERGGKRNFYDASTAINQIMAGMQEKTSDAIADAYTYVLTTYSSASTASDPQTAFEEQFRSSLLGCTAADGSARLIQNSGSGYSYSAKGLYGFLSGLPSGASVSINGYGGAESAADALGAVEVSAASTATVVLKNVSLTYRYQGYETNVTTDISIDTPDYYQSVAEYTVSGLPDYALVAKSGLTCIGSRQISGSAYAGNLEVTGGNLTLTGKGTLITPGSLRIDAGAGGFTESAGGSVWANNLVVNAGGVLTLNGKTYVSNDLELNGSSSAILDGDYYGFGNSLTLPDKSSAILANGAGSTLDLTGAGKLFLAGNSFVSNQSGSIGTSSVLMGESISSKSGQLLYLLPNENLPGNSGGVTANPQIFTAAQLLDGSGRARDLTAGMSVGGVPGASVLQLTYPLSSGQYVVYFFLKFDTVQHANEYFKSYFTAHKDTVAEYLAKYLTIAGQADIIQTRGYTVSGSGSSLALQEYITGNALDSTVVRLAGFYKSLCINLTTISSVTDPSITNPYDYYVDAGKVSGLGGPVTGTFPVSGGTAYWLVSPGDVVVSAGGSTQYSVIIAAGNVTVNTDYAGLILCGGTLTLNANINVGTNTDTALSSMSAYLKGYGRGEDDEKDPKQSWNLDQLVYYRNWSKQ